MLRMVTCGTSLLCMGTWVLGEFASWAGMAVAALSCKQVIHRHIKRGVGNNVTAHAVRKFRAMGLDVTLAAFGHDFIPVLFLRVV